MPHLKDGTFVMVDPGKIVFLKGEPVGDVPIVRALPNWRTPPKEPSAPRKMLAFFGFK